MKWHKNLEANQKQQPGGLLSTQGAFFTTLDERGDTDNSHPAARPSSLIAFLPRSERKGAALGGAGLSRLPFRNAPRSAPLHGGHGRAPLLRTGSPRAGPTAAFPADPEVHSLAWGSGRPSSRKPLPRQKNILVIISSPAPRLERTPLPPSLFSTFQHGRGLDRVRLRRSGDIGRVHWLRQSRQRPIAGCWAALWKSSWTGRLSALPESKQCLDFSDYIWNTDCRNGNKILQLWEVHACRADCWCQFANGWKISAEDVGEAP